MAFDVTKFAGLENCGTNKVPTSYGASHVERISNSMQHFLISVTMNM